jgi:hypothetical protein
MAIFQPAHLSTYWPIKGKARIYTSCGNAQDVLDVIKIMDYDEFTQYGTVNGKFVIAIEDSLVKLGEDNYALKENFMEDEIHFDYYGKFELDVNQLYTICKDEGIPICVRALEGFE